MGRPSFSQEGKAWSATLKRGSGGTKLKRNLSKWETRLMAGNIEEGEWGDKAQRKLVEVGSQVDGF